MDFKRKTIFAFLTIFFCVVLTGCSKPSQEEVPSEAVVTGPVVAGKILFDCGNWGTCVYENGKSQQWMSEAYKGFWIDKNKIMYARNTKEKHPDAGLYLMEYFTTDYPSKNEEKVLSPNEVISIKGAFKDGNRFYGYLWEKGHKGLIQNLAIYDKQNGTYQKVTNLLGDNVIISGADLSPDETRFAIRYSIYENGQRPAQMVIVDTDGKIIKQFEGLSSYPKWSPDGRFIVFSKSYPKKIGDKTIGDSEIALYDTTTGETKRLTHIDDISDQPVFSPDGKKIAFVQWKAGGMIKTLAVMDLDGSNLQYLLTDEQASKYPVYQPRWGE